MGRKQGGAIDLSDLTSLAPDAIDLIRMLVKALGEDSDGGRKLTRAELRGLGARLLPLVGKLLLGIRP